MTRTAFNFRRAASAALILAGVLALLVGGQAALARSGLRDDAAPMPTTAAPAYSASVEQCATSTVQVERSATFTAQMSAIAGTQRMGMRFELQQRLHGESEYHTVLAPGLGVWHSSEAGVQIYKYVKQVTNLDAPAVYRAVVRFRWLGDKDRLLKRAEVHTSHCLQPTLPSQVTQTSPTSPAPLS
jgi:hypothetical protein